MAWNDCHIASDGRDRYRESPQFLARARQIEAEVRRRYAPAQARAGFFQRCLLAWQMR